MIKYYTDKKDLYKANFDENQTYVWKRLIEAWGVYPIDHFNDLELEEVDRDEVEIIVGRFHI